MASKEEDDKLLAELKEALKRKEEAKDIEAKGKAIKLPSKNGGKKDKK